jgi:hypothetical protein
VNRILGIASAMLLSLFVLLPATAAAEPFTNVEHFIFSNGGDVTIPAGQHVDALLVIDGAATIEGDVDGVIVVNGTAHFVAGQAGGVVAVNSTVSLDPTSSVSGDIRTFDSTVDQATGAVVSGQVIDGAAEIDWPGAAQVVTALAILAFLGLLTIGLLSGLAAAGLAARQVRGAGSLIVDELGLTIVAAFAGLFGIIGFSLLAIITVVGIPVGLATLIVIMPALFFAGWLVAAIWLGDLIVGRLTPTVTRERPYLASVIGVVTLAVLGIVPLVGGIIAFLGFGAVTLALWRTFRGPRLDPATPPPAAAPVV